MTRTTRLVAFCVGILVSSASASAEVVGNMTYTWSGVGSGTLGGTTFENRSLRIEVIAFSTDIEQITNPLYPPGEQILVSASNPYTSFNFNVDGLEVATSEQDLWMATATGDGLFGVGFNNKSVNDSDYEDAANSLWGTETPTDYYLSLADSYREQSVETVYVFPGDLSVATSAGAINISSFSGTFEAINANKIPGAPGVFLLAGCIRTRRRRH